MEDEMILDLYFARDERAVAETDKKYGGYCFSLANAILGNQEDAEETVSDTYLQTWKTIPPKRPDIFKMFLAKITRNLAFDCWRSSHAAKRGGGEMAMVLEELDGCIAGPGRVEDGWNARELALCIRKFLDTLPVRQQDLFLRRYFYVEETTQIAARYGMKPAAVQRNLSRTRQKLKQYLMQEGYSV